MSLPDRIYLAVEQVEAAYAAHGTALADFVRSRAKYHETLATLRARQREFDNLVAEVNAQNAAAGSLWSIDPPKTT